MARSTTILSVRLLPAEKAEAQERARQAGLSVNAFIVRAISGPAPFETLAPEERYERLKSVREAMFAPSPVMEDIPWKDGELPRYTVRTPLPSPTPAFATMEDGTDHPASVEVVGATDAEDAQWMLDQASREADRSFPDGDSLRYGDVATVVDPVAMGEAIAAGVVRYGGGAGGGKMARFRGREAEGVWENEMPPVIATPKGPLVLKPGAINVFDARTGELTTLATFGCGHAKTPENSRKVGKGRVGCKTCRKAVDRRHAEAKARAS